MVIFNHYQKEAKNEPQIQTLFSLEMGKGSKPLQFGSGLEVVLQFLLRCSQNHTITPDFYHIAKDFRSKILQDFNNIEPRI